MNKHSRRKFIAGAIAVGAAQAASAMPLKTTPEKKQLVHHVFFWLKNAGNADDRAKLVEGLHTLSGIETVHKLRIGVPADTEKRPVVDSSFDVSELIFFEDTAAQLTYQKHPIHLKFVEVYSHLWEKVIVYDMMEID